MNILPPSDKIEPILPSQSQTSSPGASKIQEVAAKNFSAAQTANEVSSHRNVNTEQASTFEALQEYVKKINTNESSTQRVLSECLSRFSAISSKNSPKIKSNLEKNAAGAYEIGTYIQPGSPPKVCYKIKATFVLFDPIDESKTISFDRMIYTSEEVKGPPDQALLAASKYKELVISLAKKSSPGENQKREVFAEERSFTLRFKAKSASDSSQLISIKTTESENPSELIGLVSSSNTNKKRNIRLLNLSAPGDKPIQLSVDKEIQGVEYRYLNKEDSLQHARYHLKNEKASNLFTQLKETDSVSDWVDSTRHEITKNFEEMDKIKESLQDKKFFGLIVRDSELLKSALKDINEHLPNRKLLPEFNFDSEQGSGDLSMTTINLLKRYRDQKEFNESETTFLRLIFNRLSMEFSIPEEINLENLTKTIDECIEKLEEKINSPISEQENRLSIDIVQNAFKLELARFQRLNERVITLHEQLESIKSKIDSEKPDNTQVFPLIKEKELQSMKRDHGKNEKFINEIVGRIHAFDLENTSNSTDLYSPFSEENSFEENSIDLSTREENNIDLSTEFFISETIVADK